ncbi:MAG: hypothetical protein GC152_13900 [Alphaproteobacteria bacterium]|nr:hypothetical protein [Alphaproteobacteria bacterium]
MIWLVLQIWIFVFGAFVLGAVLGAGAGWMAGRQPAAHGGARSGEAGNRLGGAEIAAGALPMSPPPRTANVIDDAGDDLGEIIGMTEADIRRLGLLGVRRFGEIASWTDDNIRWVEHQLGEPGRIGRERWVEQARSLFDQGAG